MNEKTRASRGATAGLSNGAFLAVSAAEYGPTPQSLQAEKLRRRFILSPAVAAVMAGHLLAKPEHWDASR